MHALVTADTIGGVWTYTRELVTGLCHHGVRVTLVSFGDIPQAEQCAWMNDLRDFEYRPTAFRLEWMQDVEDDIRASSEYLLAIIAEVNPDVLHLSQFCYGDLAVDVPKVVIAHSDVVSWWLAVHGQEPQDSGWIRWYRNVVSRGIAGADVVVTPSLWMLQQLVQHYGEPPRAQVIANGRSPGLFSPYASKEELALSAGRLWDAGKQVSLLLQCEHRIPIRVVGSDRPPDGSIDTVGVGKLARGSFVGVQTEPALAQLLSRAAIYVATSRYEPFGLAPLEAALSRCALVLNDISPFREIWDDAGLYFAANDAYSLAALLERLRQQPKLRAEYGNRAFERARRMFTAERMVDDYVGLYAKLAPRAFEHMLARAIA